MIEFREGCSDALVEMVMSAFSKLDKYKNRLPENPKEILSTRPWIVGGYDNERCAVALWGDSNSINIICDPLYKGKWATRRLIRQFFRYFFERYDTAIAEADEYRDLWKRCGFIEGNDGKLYKFHSAYC